jgi:hypothetical protein
MLHTSKVLCKYETDTDDYKQYNKSNNREQYSTVTDIKLREDRTEIDGVWWYIECCSETVPWWIGTVTNCLRCGIKPQ